MKGGGNARKLNGPMRSLWTSSYLKSVLYIRTCVMHEIRPSCLIMETDMANYSQILSSGCLRLRKPKGETVTACY